MQKHSLQIEHTIYTIYTVQLLHSALIILEFEGQSARSLQL